MDIQTQSAATVAQSTSGGATSENALTGSKEAANALTSDFETFLKLLTTQLQNQDPLNPLDSQDFAVQLATFSGVEQQVRTNELLEALSKGLGNSGIAQLAGWVGMEARVTAPFSFDGAPVTISPAPASGAENAVLVVRDEFGREVQRESVPVGADTLDWAGVGVDGAPLPVGTYTLELESYSRGELLGTSPVAHYALISEARLAGEGVEIVLQGGTRIGSDSVSGLRTPAAG